METTKPVTDNLEPYRQLIDLQKQMIELAQQHERAKRKRDALHEEMVREAADRRHNGRGLRHRLKRSAARLLKRVPGFTLEKITSATLNHK